MLERAASAGAVAGKVCGAGGGGCLFCLSEPEHRNGVANALASAGATVLPVRVEAAGLTIDRRP